MPIQVLDTSLLAPLSTTLDKGGATLIAAVIAACISSVSLVVTLFSARAQARLVSDLTDTITVNKEARDYKLKQLTLFYDPIYTLLAANKNIFDRIGPGSTVRDNPKFHAEETAEVWKKLSADVIIPNNMRICEIISGNLHFISDSDTEDLYLEFLTHAHAYKTFKDSAYEAYTLFQCPKNFFKKVKDARNDVRFSLQNLYSIIK